MSTNLSIKEVLARLEAQYALHQEREAFHAGQEALHREQRALHAGEMETLSRNLEAFRMAAEAVAGLASRAAVRLPGDEEALDTGRRGLLTRLITRVLEDKDGAERFGILGVTAELNRRFADKLRPPADPRQVSVVLRRFAHLGRIHLVRRGRPHHEALYVREAPTGP